MSSEDDEIDRAAEAQSDAGTPRWVFVFAVVGVLIVAGFIVLHLAGGGFRHDMRP